MTSWALGRSSDYEAVIPGRPKPPDAQVLPDKESNLCSCQDALPGNRLLANDNGGGR